MARSPIRISSWIVLGIAALLIGLTVFLINTPQGKSITMTPTPTAGETILFPADMGTVIRVNIKDQAGKEVDVARDAATGAWTFSEPRQGTASPGSVEAATAQVPYMTILTRLEATAEPAVYGLTKPVYDITLHFQNGPAKSLKIGDATPTGSGYYVRLDDGSLVVVSKAGIDSLIALYTTPPFAETETPTPLPVTDTPTVTPTLPETATPEGTAESAPQASTTETATAEIVPTETATETPTP